MNIKIISLKHSPLRNKRFSTSLSYSFYDAKTGENEKNVFDKKKSEMIYGRAIRSGEIGCSLSHHDIAVEFYHRGDDEWLVVLEDDALLELDFDKCCHDINKYAFNKAYIIILGYSKCLKSNHWVHKLKKPLYRQITIGNFFFGENDVNHRGTVGYIINKQAAKIMTEQEKVFWIADDWLYIRSLGINIMHPYQPVVYEDLTTGSTTSNEVTCFDSIREYPAYNIYMIIKERFKYYLTNIFKR